LNPPSGAIGRLYAVREVRVLLKIEPSWLLQLLCRRIGHSVGLKDLFEFIPLWGHTFERTTWTRRIIIPHLNLKKIVSHTTSNNPTTKTLSGGNVMSSEYFTKRLQLEIPRDLRFRSRCEALDIIECRLISTLEEICHCFDLLMIFEERQCEPLMPLVNSYFSQRFFRYLFALSYF
jgi:hypothetical protein